MKNWEEIFLTFEADCTQRNIPRMHILWLRAQCLICIKTDIEFPRGPEKPRNARSNFSAVTAMFWNSQSKKSNFLTWPDLAFGFAQPRDLGTRLVTQRLKHLQPNALTTTDMWPSILIETYWTYWKASRFCKSELNWTFSYCSKAKQTKFIPL